MRRSAVLGACALSAACSSDRVIGTEPWSTPPEIRIAVVARGESATARALDALTPVQEPLGAADEPSELWLFSYRADTLRAAFPGLVARTLPEILAVLAPVADAREGVLPPPADEVLSADLAQASDGLTYQRRGWSDWTQRSTSGLSFRLQLPDDAVCGSFAVETVDVPAELHVDGIATAGPRTVYATGLARTTTTGPLQVHVLRDQSWQRLPDRTARGPSYGHPAWDAATRTVWDIDADAQLYRFDGDGAAQPVPAPPPEPAQPSAQWVSVGVDGTLMATYLHPSEIGNGMTDISPGLYRHDGTAWQYALIPDGSFGFVDVVSSERVIAYYHCWIYFYRDATMTNGWSQGLFDDSCRSVRDADLDEDGGIITGVNGYARLRDDAANGWIDASLGLPRQTFVAAAALGEGRALVGSDQGALFVRRGPRWCPIAHGLTDAVVERAEAVPGGGAAYVLMRSGEAQKLVRVEIVP